MYAIRSYYVVSGLKNNEIVILTPEKINESGTLVKITD